ncbi:MAG: hypothetical protein JSS02_21715 [Planctomycetes bacterium]|nr:hypothetical protein [Planctomycetota bacterium]
MRSIAFEPMLVVAIIAMSVAVHAWAVDLLTDPKDVNGHSMNQFYPRCPHCGSATIYDHTHATYRCTKCP